MNRTATVFLTIIATLTGVLGLGQSIALGTDFELLPIAGIIGGLIPFVCGVAFTLMLCVAFKKSNHEELDGPEDLIEQSTN